MYRSLDPSKKRRQCYNACNAKKKTCDKIELDTQHGIDKHGECVEEIDDQCGNDEGEKEYSVCEDAFDKCKKKEKSEAQRKSWETLGDRYQKANEKVRTPFLMRPNFE